MRGLTPEERIELIEAARPLVPAQHEAPVATMAEYEVNMRLERQGRVRVVAWETETHSGEAWLATDFGALALRVCPIGEP